MNYREHFNAIMHYGSFDRMPVMHWTGWPETLERWRAEGMPQGASEHEFFNAQGLWYLLWCNLDLLPLFPEEVLQETDEYRIKRCADGTVCQEWKHKSCIPHFIDFTLKTAADWPEYKKRLQPDPSRIPADIAARCKAAEASGMPVCAHATSLMGWIRNWMGVENMSYLFYDDRDCYADMVNTLADLTCWSLDRILPHLSRPADLCFNWEDICGRSGPLVSPEIFQECVAPGYRKITAKLRQYGVKLYGVDCDGEVSALLGPWLECGVNLQFPIEVGAWKGDAHAHRRRFGKELRVIGNFDKLAMERGRADVAAEIQRLTPLMKEGGFIIMPDHLITPGVSLQEYQWYLDQIRAIRL